MPLPQTGIFALGNPAHAYLEYDLLDPSRVEELVPRAARLSVSETTMGAVNVVIGFRPEVWRAGPGRSAPDHATSFAEPVVGADGFTMPATQHDVAVWVAGASTDVVFDAATEATAALRDLAELAEETNGWTYHRDLDLTGFTDGSENPKLSVAPQQVIIADDQPGAGGSVLLLQRWTHDAPTWSALSQREQEQVIGRTKVTDEELDDRPETSHVARTDQEDFGHIFRRNTPFGGVREHGTMFVGFAADQKPLATMLTSMAGVDGPRDALTLYTTPVSGSYYFVPSLSDLTTAAGPLDDD